MKIIDISMKITPDMAVYKNKAEKRPSMRLIASHQKDGAQDTELTISMHTGTHMDAPLHMIDGGKTIEDTPLSKLIAPCRVLDFSALADRITQADLKQKTINAGEFILLKTLNSEKDTFDFDFVFLDKSGAEYLKEKGAIGVGIDALGIERSQSNHETHHVLLGSDIPIIEGLRLNDVDEGQYTLIALPINLPGAEAALVRAVLLPAGSII